VNDLGKIGKIFYCYDKEGIHWQRNLGPVEWFMTMPLNEWTEVAALRKKYIGASVGQLLYSKYNKNEDWG